ncbi:hypothetical protein LJB92_00285 [Bacteroidales bacterium OttesenSCG-928-M06]|nr:hypothetical protein [Bacteroidales bacterium OttesenSCG-928-M06]
MKRVFLFLGFISLIFFVTACSRVSADANEEVIFDYHPVFWGKKGIDPIPFNSGSCFKLPWTKVHKFIMSPVQYEEGFKNLISSDQASVNLNAFITLQIEPGKSPELLKRYGIDWYKNNVQEVFREIIRNKLCFYNLKELTTDRILYENIKEDVYKKMIEYINKKQIPVSIENLVISKAEPSESVREEMDNLAKENVKLETEVLKRKTAEASLDRIVLEARAIKMAIGESGLTPTLYVELQKILALAENQSKSVILLANDKGE